MLQDNANHFRRAARTKEKPVKKVAKKAVQGGEHKNLIKQILAERGYKTIVPTDDVLQTLDITLHRFNKILDNKTELTLNEANGFANWLGVPLDELTSAPTHHTHHLADKFGLKD